METVSIGVRKIIRQGNKYVVTVPRRVVEDLFHKEIVFVEVILKPVRGGGK